MNAGYRNRNKACGAVLHRSGTTLVQLQTLKRQFNLPSAEADTEPVWQRNTSMIQQTVAMDTLKIAYV